MLFYVVLTYYFFSNFAFANIEPVNASIDDYYVKNIVNVLNSNFEFPHVGIICENQTNFCSRICTQIQQIPIPVSIFTLKNTLVSFSGKLNILYFHSENTLINFIRKNYLNLDVNLHYVIFLKNANIEETLYTMWSRFKIRRAILFDNIGSYEAYIHDIISNSSKKINLKEFISKHIFDMRNFKKSFLRVTLFERVPEVMKINNKLYGANYKLLEVLSDKLNFTPVVLRSSDRKKFGSYAHGKYTGGLADIVYGKSDIACNGYFIKKPDTEEYKYLYPFNMDYVCLLVPKAGKIPKYMAPFKCFPQEVWLAMLLAFGSVGLVRYFIYYVHRNYLKWEENSNIPLSLFSIAINMPVSFWQFKYPSSRIILIIFLSQMYVIVTSFQGSLVMLLSVPMFYKDIDTLAELNRTKMEIKVGKSGLSEVFKQDDLLRTMASRVKRVKDEDFRNFNFAFLARFIHHKQKMFRTFSIKKQNRSVIVHKITECPLKYYTTFVVGWNFSFVEEFNSIIRRVVESGLIMKWDGEINFKIIKLLKPEIALKNGNEQMENKIFTFNDLEVAFIVLIFGYCCSFITFIVEVIIKM